MGSRYSDDSKWWTLDCESCPNRHSFYCYWGLHRIRLVTAYDYGKLHRPRHCEYVKKPPMRGAKYWEEWRKYNNPGAELPKVVVEQLKLMFPPQGGTG